MRILSVLTHTEQNTLTLQFEIIKSPELDKKRDFYHYDGKATRAQALASDGYHVTESRCSIKAHHQDETSAVSQFNVKLLKIKLNLPNDYVRAISLFNNLDYYLKTDKCDHIFFEVESIEKYFVRQENSVIQTKEMSSIHDVFRNMGNNRYGDPIGFLSIPISEFVKNKKAFPSNTSLSSYLAQEVIKNNSLFGFLNALQLLDPAVDKSEKLIILNALAKLKQIHDDGNQIDELILNHFKGNRDEGARYKKSVLQCIMNKIQQIAKYNLIRPCLGEPAYDGGNYYDSYTEIQFLLLAKINYCGDGRVSLSVTDNPLWLNQYTKDKRLDGKLEPELRFLGNMIGLEFASDSTFDGTIIFTKECSERLIKTGILYNADFLNNLMKFEKIFEDPKKQQSGLLKDLFPAASLEKKEPEQTRPSYGLTI